MTPLRRYSKIALEKVEAWFDAAFGPRWNPFYQLGALGWFFFWVVLVSGIYLYIFFDTGVTEAFRSVEEITHGQWYAGGIMRSLHRYASDALVVVVLLHLLREFVLDRFRGKRWFAWVTGVPTLWLIFACGISGYWLVWDTLAQYVAIATSEWLDALPLFGEPIARNFLNEETLSGRLFTLMVFIHILAPLVMLVIMWVHIQRNAHARINPPRGLAAGTLASMVVLSVISPAVSHDAANLDRVVTTVNPDWFYLPIYPLLEQVSGLTMWAAVGLGTVLLLVLPWVPPMKREPAAQVNLDNCNGCGRCRDDCPFNAIEMEPRSDGLAFDFEAVVTPNRCVSCGICAGACPTATPFRRATALVPGIELPDYTIQTLRDKTLAVAQALRGERRILIYGCDFGADLRGVANDEVGVVNMPCVAMLPPPFVDFVLRRGHADGVLFSGCRDNDCHYRFGTQWTQQRIAGGRDPVLRKRVARERIAQCWTGLGASADIKDEIARLQMRLESMSTAARGDWRATKQTEGPYG